MSVLAVTGSTESDIPSTWNIVGIEDIAAVNPRIDAAGLDGAGQVHFIPMSAVEEDFGGIDTSRLRPLAEVRKGYTWFVEDDVLLAKITPCMENGKGALVPHLEHGHAFGSTEFHVLRPNGATSSKWLAHYLSQPEFRRVARQNMTGSAGQLRVPTNWLANAGIPVAPFAEQTRIVEKLEELLSDLDAGVAELKAAQHKLAQYRQSLLKAAVEGALTADWRAARRTDTESPSPSSPRTRESSDLVASTTLDNSLRSPSGPSLRDDQRASRLSHLRGNDEQPHDAPSHETGADLLQRILTQRRARWEAKQLAKFTAQSKAPPNGWQAKYPAPVAPDITGLPALPDGWVWASVDQLADMVRNGLSQKPSTERIGYPILRINAVRPMSVRLDEVRYLSLSEKEASFYLLDEGDLLATRYNGSVDLLGVFGVVRGLVEPTVHPDKLIRIKPVLGAPLADWIEMCASTGASRMHVVSRVKTTAGQTGISGEDVKKMPIPLPPVSEQLAASEMMAAAMVGIADQDVAVERALKQAAAQRKNLLKAAFAGQLVPQDPSDEPASVLLERIRAERAASGANPIKRGRKVREHA